MPTLTKPHKISRRLFAGSLATLSALIGRTALAAPGAKSGGFEYRLVYRWIDTYGNKREQEIPGRHKTVEAAIQERTDVIATHRESTSVETSLVIDIECVPTAEWRLVSRKRVAAR
jgi:hypothetical protein